MLSSQFRTPDRELEALYHLLRGGTKYDWNRRSHALRDQLLEHGVVEEVVDVQGLIQELGSPSERDERSSISCYKVALKLLD